MDLSISGTPGGKAAAAGTSARRACLLACMAWAAALYVSQERAHATAEARLRAAGLPASTAVRVAPQRPGQASAGARNVAFDSKERMACAGPDGTGSRGAEIRFRDGARIFVCGAGVSD